MADPEQDKETQLYSASGTGLPGAVPRNADLAGVLVKERYRIEKALGRGGFAVTYLAADTQMDSRPVVIKVLLDHHSDDKWVLKKFYQEMQALARLDHPGVVGALDTGQLPDGSPFLVIQYVKGEPLRKAMNPGRGMDLERAGNIVRQVGQALSAAHQEGIYHRDVKPDNIMLHTLEDGEERVKLIDFGIASIRDARALSTGDSTKISGTLAYMAPEQFQGVSSVSSDIYALGVVAYEMVTGRLPLIAEHPMQFIGLHQEGVKIKPKDLRPALPEEAQAAMLKALSKKPEDRFARARDFGEAFQRGLAANSNVSTSTITQPYPTPQTPKRLRWIGIGIGVIAAAVAFGAWTVWQRRQVTVPVEVEKPTPVTAAVNIPQPPTPPPAVDNSKVEKTSKTGVSKTSVRKSQMNPRDELTYVWIPAGTFSMGCSVGDTACAADEAPRRSVTITKGFWMGQTEVTQEAYLRVTARNQGAQQGKRLPIASISFEESQAYCNAVGLRLPSEAEWEYAARAGSSAVRYGDLDAVAWNRNNSGNVAHDVAGRASNDFGLYDMLGNVREWVQDWYGPDFYKLGPTIDPVGPSSGPFRIQRGGAYPGDANIRASARFRNLPSSREVDAGLRCAGSELPSSTLAPAELARLARTRVNPADGLTYVWVPSGRFTMGCSNGDTECAPVETPHQVVITKPFWIGETEVTQEAFEKLMHKNPSGFVGTNLPVNTVQWNDAQAYCTAVGMRLPTEAEWEYAARGGNASARYGDLNAIGWYNANSGQATHPPKQKQPNEFGLYDMLGNVYEWVSDWFSTTYYRSSPVNDPQGPPTGTVRAMRGGFWNAGSKNARASDRWSGTASGLRCAGN